MNDQKNQPLPTLNKYGKEVKVQKIVSRKKRRLAIGDNTMSPFERFAASNGSAKITSF